ncbi:MAG: sugar phosphate nucleotidyltransferase [Thermomicrobium sp.]|nr:sugar phosphate nucleotidyltransferase [Thermomicrobium sp.]MDW7982347.1 sugar phosphate nucleotidyltransferase [Thermomicrobium sp.]
MHVVIPVAGLGTRLRPHTWSKPKPLVTVAGKPILGHVLDRLLRLPLDRVVFVTGYLGEQIEQFVRQHYRFDAVFVEQPEPLGQSHALLQASGLVDGPTLVVFPDLIFDANLEALVGCPWDGVVFVKEVDDPRRFGVVIVESGRIVRLVEKPTDPVSRLAVVGVYYFRSFADLLEAIEEQIAMDRRRGNEYYLAEAIQILIDRGRTIVPQPVTVWEDCGTVDALLQTNRFLLDRRAEPPPAIPTSVVVPPVVIDPTATIEHAVVGPYVSIGPHAVVAHAIVTDSIIDEGARIENVMLHRSIVGRQARVRGDFLRVNVGDSSEISFAQLEDG